MLRKIIQLSERWSLLGDTWKTSVVQGVSVLTTISMMADIEVSKVSPARLSGRPLFIGSGQDDFTIRLLLLLDWTSDEDDASRCDAWRATGRQTGGKYHYRTAEWKEAGTADRRARNPSTSPCGPPDTRDDIGSAVDRRSLGVVIGIRYRGH